MQVRIQTPSVAGTPQFSNGKTSRLGRSYGVSWSDSVSVTSASPRMLPFRPAVHDLTVAVPSTVLTTPAISTTIRSIDKGETDGATGGSGVRKQSALYKYYIDPGLRHNDSHQPHHDKEPHVPAQEPPGRPPSRLESHYFSAADFNGDHPLDKHAGDNSLMGSQEALSVGSAPELQTASGLESLGAGQQPVNHPDSDDDGGRVITSRGTTTRSSGRGRSRLLVSRQKQKESWRTMKRRIKLAEDQKRSTSKPKEKPKAKDQKESFEEWLDRKRREERGGQNSSGKERKQLMGAILRADLTQLSAIEQHTFRTRRAPRQISFTQWREKVDRREGEIRQQRQRMRKEAELRQEALAPEKPEFPEEKL
nr:hypothetical protein BaRGS_030700 [Batillaria attramentaria]